MFSETKQNKRIRVLKDEEYQQIYGLPTFSREEQEWFFELTQQELSFLDTAATPETKIDAIFQLGYFKAKQNFFTWTFNSVQSNFDYIRNRYFDNVITTKTTIGRKAKYNNQQWVLSLFGYALFSKEKHKKLCAYQPEKAAIQAGRIMLDRIHTLANEKVNFAFETTLASRTFAMWIPKLQKEGYQFHLIFLWLQNADLAVFRVKERVKTGGHSVPEETIRRRYTAGLRNFFNLYSPLADSWQFYDNSNTNHFSLIASEAKYHSLIVKDEKTWKQLLEISNEKR